MVPPPLTKAPGPPGSIAVIGAGLSGLTAAYRLSTALPRTRITLLDASPRAGGWVSSQRHLVRFATEDGRTVEGELVCEAGPRTIRPRGGRGAAEMLGLIRDLGLAPKILPIPTSHPAAKNRYLLDPATSKLELVRPSLSALLSRASPASRALVLAAMAEPFRGSRAAGAKGTDESVASFFARRLGPAGAAVSSAFVHGIYAADPERLSMRAAFGAVASVEDRYGSVLLGFLAQGLLPHKWTEDTGARAVREAEEAAWSRLGELGKEREGWSMYALEGGMGSLTDRLQAAAREAGVDARLGAAIHALRPVEDGVEIQMADGQALQTSHVVTALPPSRLSSLISASAPLPHLDANPSTTVGVVNVVYSLPPSSVHPDGFGYLVPRSAPGTNPDGALGVVFDSAALPGLDGSPALEGHVTKVTVMMGGPHWTSYGTVPPPGGPGDLVEPALRHLRRVFPHLAGVEPLLAVPHLNAACIPTYAPGHGGRLGEVHSAIGSGPWAGRLSVAGAGYGGVSVNDCVLSGHLVAEGLAHGTPVTGLERWANTS